MEQLVIPGTDNYVPLTDIELTEKYIAIGNELRDLQDIKDFAERFNRPTPPLARAFALLYNQQTRLLQAHEQRGLSMPELIERN